MVFCVITPKYFNERCVVTCVVKLQSKFYLCRYINSRRIDHESYVVLPSLSPPSVSTSSSCKNLPFTYRWRHCIIKKSLKTIWTRKFVFSSYEYVLAFESFDVDFWRFWSLQIFMICYHQISWPTSPRTWLIACIYIYIFLSALSFKTDVLSTCLSR